MCLAFSFDWYSVEQRHDLPDHVARSIVAELLGERDQPDPALARRRPALGLCLDIGDRLISYSGEPSGPTPYWSSPQWSAGLPQTHSNSRF